MGNIESALKVMGSEALEKKIANANSLDDVKKAFEDEGVFLSEDDILKINDAMIAASQEDGAELSAVDLDEVAGGGKISDAIKIGWKLGKAFYKFEKKLYKKLGLKYD